MLPADEALPNVELDVDHSQVEARSADQGSCLDGTLPCGRCSFPYFAIMAFETGGVLRPLLLLLLAPLEGILYYYVSESAGIQVLIFASMAGVKVADIAGVARAVLPNLYCSDLHPESWPVFSACGRQFVLTANQRIMVDAFLKEYIGSDAVAVLGTHLVVWACRETGLARSPGVLVGEKKADVLWKAFGDATATGRVTTHSCGSARRPGYVVSPTPKLRPVPQEELPKRVIFHDGQIVQKPSPALALITVL